MDKAQFLTLILAILSVTLAVGATENAIRERPPLNIDSIGAFLCFSAVVFRLLFVH